MESRRDNPHPLRQEGPLTCSDWRCCRLMSWWYSFTLEAAVVFHRVCQLTRSSARLRCSLSSRPMWLFSCAFSCPRAAAWGEHIHLFWGRARA